MKKLIAIVLVALAANANAQYQQRGLGDVFGTRPADASLYPNTDVITINSITTPIGFARASVGYSYSVTGSLTLNNTDVARVDYEPSTLSPNGLLIEASGLNTQPFGTSLTQMVTKENTTVSISSLVAPDGVGNWFEVSETTATGAHNIRSPFSGFVTNTVYTFSGYFRNGAAGRGRVSIAPSTSCFGANLATNFDISDGRVVQVPTSITFAGVQRIDSATVRVYMSALATSSTVCQTFWHIASGTSINYTGETSRSVLMWGLMVEPGNNGLPKSFISNTNAGTVSRAPDLMVITPTVLNSTGRNTVLQYFTLMHLPTIGSLTTVFHADSGVGNDNSRLAVKVDGNGLTYLNYGAASTTMGSIAGTSLTENRVAISWGLNRAYASLNGQSAVSLTQFIISPTFTTWRLGSNVSGTEGLNGWTRFRVYDGASANLRTLR